jgi:hypothetical protein
MRRYGLVDIPTEASDVNAVPVSADSIISGGVVTWSGTGLIFNVSACNYYIDNLYYNSPDATLTLDPADPTDDRIDVFAVDINGDAIVITGTPSATPQEPQVDPATQIKLTTVIVQAGATTPLGVANNMIYDENVELWSKSNSSLTVDYVNTTTPYVGTYCILATTTSASTFKALTFYKASTYSNKSDYDLFSFAIKLSQSLLNTESIKIIFSNLSLYPNVKVAEYAITSNNSIGLSFSNTSSYQLIGIPIANITFTNNSFNYVQIQFITSRTGISFRLDRILLQYGITQVEPPNESNSFGFVESDSGTASATTASDTIKIFGTGLASTSVSGKTLTISVPTPIPTQTGNNGKYLKTDGSALSWDFPLNIYNSNGSLSSDRTLTAGNYSLTLSGTKTSGTSFYFQNSQTGTNATDQADGTLSINYNINGSSGTELVARAVSMGVDNNMTGGTVTNMRAWNLAYTTASGSTTSNLDLIYLESVTSAGTVTNVRGLRINILQGTNQAGLTFNSLSGTNNAYAIFGQTSIPTGNWGIYQSESSYTNYFAGKLLIGTTTIGTESLNVVGSAIISSTTTLSSLAGSGDRMVVANSSGVLSTQAIPGGGGSMAIGGSITSATAGSVLFAGTSGVLQQDNANFFWDDANNRLGIGTATPTADIDITKGINGAVVHQIKNTTTGTSAQAVMNFIADSSNTAQMQKLSTSFATPVAPLLGGDFAITNYSSGHMVFVNNFSTGRIKFAAGGSSTAQMSLTAAGRLLVGTTSESTSFIIDAVGSGRFSQNQNAGTFILISNTTNGASAQSYLTLTSDSSSGSFLFGKRSASIAITKIINPKDGFIYNDTGGDIAILNDFATGKIKFAAGASSTAQMTLTAAGRLLIGTTSESTFILDVNGTTRLQNNVTISNGFNLILGTATGTKIGTATDQKIGFFNATPVIQQNTTISIGTFTANSGTNINTNSTIDGYTLRQVVAALRNLGLLA